MPSTIRLRLLGRPDVAFDGRVDVLRAERHQRLLAYLALSGNWIERADLSALLWPVHARELAGTNLRKALHVARALPWAQAVETQGSRVRFAIGCDVNEFDTLAREGRLVDALRVHRGVLLDGFDDEANPAWTAWLADERARLAKRWQALAHARLGQLPHAPHESAALARELLALDPFDDDAVIALMRSQRLTGRIAEANDTFRRYLAELSREGLQPSTRMLAYAETEQRTSGDGASVGGFVGREREIEELAALLARAECRLLTITGPGGVGKSRLAKEAIRRLVPEFGEALWLPLDDLRQSSQAVARLASALDVTPAPQQDALALVCSHARLRDLLLVLDNAEQVDGLARVIERMLGSVAGLKICATSRVRLNVRGEWLLPLAGLALPHARGRSEDPLACDASRLFVSAAMAVRPGFDGAVNVHHVTRLVRAVDGLPLAILLAANWARLWPVERILSELERSLDVLDAGEEGEERPEHRSVRATFEHSWRLLNATERRALEALSVFIGTFSLAAAKEVADAPWPLFAGLADKSLLQMLDDGRCSMHPLIHQFADERLDVAARRDAKSRHAHWFHRYLADVERDFQARGPKALDAVEADLENCRSAWRWAVNEADGDALATVATPLLRFFETRGRALEGLDLLSEALAIDGAKTSDACAASVVSAISHLQFRVGRIDDAMTSAKRSLKLARAARSRSALLRSLNVLGLCHWQSGRQPEAKRLLDQSLRLARESRDAHAEAVALGNLSNVEKAMGNYEGARELGLRCLQRTREIGDWVGVAIRLNSLAHVYQSQFNWAPARDCLAQGLEVTETHAIAFVRPHLLVNLAHVEFFAGNHDEAERVAQRTLTEAREESNGVVETTALLLLVRLCVRRRAFADARTLVRQAIDCARRGGWVPLQLDAVFCFAEILAGEGAPLEAGSLMRYYIDRPDIEPGDRAVAQAELEKLGPEAARREALTLDLDTLLARILDETRGAPAVASTKAGAG